MTPLQRLESEILQDIDGLTLRPTLEKVCRIGRLLTEAKALIAYGEWTRWVRRVGLSLRTSQLYMQAYAHAEEAKSISSTKRMTLVDFLAAIRRAKREASKRLLEEWQGQAAGKRNGREGRYRIVHADCRKYRWPEAIDLIATDPPWQDLDCYRWLADFSKVHLKLGGLLLVQCHTGAIPRVLDVMRELTYVWTLCIRYEQTNTTAPFGAHHPIVGVWRPVLLFCNGVFAGRGRPSLSDACTVSAFQSNWHRWEQPLKPWKYWLERLSEAGHLIADPFAGSGTTGVAAKMLGRSYLGTEVDRGHASVAQRRLAETHEGGVPAP